MENEKVCFECGEEADPQYTVDFSILGEDNLHYCSLCGEMVKAIEKELDKAIGF